MDIFSRLVNNKEIRDNLKRDCINESQYKINLAYLNEAKKHFLYPREVFEELKNIYASPCSYYQDDDLELLDIAYDLFSESQRQLLKKTTPAVIKIAYNLKLPRLSLLLPSGIQDNPTEYYWFIAAYPDVFDYFYTPIDLKKYGEQGYVHYMEKLSLARGEELMKLLDIFEKKYEIPTEAPKEKLAIKLMYKIYLMQKDYYKNTLKKEFLLAD